MEYQGELLYPGPSKNIMQHLMIHCTIYNIFRVDLKPVASQQNIPCCWTSLCDMGTTYTSK